MSKIKCFVFIFGALAVLSAHIFAQGPAQPAQDSSFDVILQVVIGGDSKTAGGQLPQNLSSIVRQLKSNYNFADVMLANTYVGRVSNGGNFEFKSISNLFGRESSPERPSFLEWALSGFRVESKEGGGNQLAAHTFRFGARIPINSGTGKDGDGKQMTIYNYENIGLTAGRVTLTENIPTLLGSLSLPNTDSTMFLVLTLRPA